MTHWAPRRNKAVYTTATVADGWAGAVMIWAGAVMIWAGAVMIWAGACSNTNFSTLKMPKNAKKSKVGQTDRPTDRQTDRPTDRQTDRPTNLLIEAPCRSLKIKHNGELN